MSEKIVEFKGMFQMWWYSSRGSRLLLRSQASEHRSTQVDILFTGAASLELATAFYDIRIERVDLDELPHAPVFGGTPAAGLERYRVAGRSREGREFTGHVVASSIHVDESNLAHYDDSPLLPSESLIPPPGRK